MAYNLPVIRWTYKLTSDTNKIRFENSGGGSASLQTLSSTPSYINRGETGSSGPTDMIDAFRTALYAARTALSLGGSWAVAIDPDTQKLRVTRVSGTSPADDLVINWAHVDSTFDPGLLGFDGATTTTFVGGQNYSPFQVDHIFYPQTDAQHVGAKKRRRIAREVRNRNGKPIIRRGTPNQWRESVLDLREPGIAAAIMLDSRAAEADYAAYAEVSVGEKNTWERMWDHGLESQGPDEGAIYLFDTNDPSVHVQSGPFFVIWSKSTPGLEGVEEYTSGRSDEVYPVILALWSAS